MNTGFRVLSCNLFSGRADVAELLDLIDRESVDIVCAQELSPNLATALAGILPFGNMSHDQIVRGSGIASRFPIDTTRIRMPKRDGWVAALSPLHWERLSYPIEIVNVHISGPHLWPYFPHPVRRRVQLEALLANRALSNDVPHAVFGDFNSSPLWPVYRKMAARYVDGVTTALNGSGEPLGTWPNIPPLGIRGLLRIDHCFLWKLASRSARIVNVPGSDHLGLLVELDCYRS